MTAVELGIGRLSWPRGERVSDRYGCVLLMHDGDSLIEPSGYVHFDTSLAGTRGSLVAHVLETRDSTHIGDLFRGLFPQTPDVGETFRLGTGEVFLEQVDGNTPCIGLDPGDGRQSDWLDPRALYRVHEQTVRLTFEPARGAS